ncbi:hypothetical protein [Paenibacillus sp. PL91]|uniref:hypothetical protein n=1 Tax=Paenibacillus sp. PL91 TaxID=2729538 RepID=UPI00145D040E|nr:hypothetical protein [Paenibacillus sp. PL91]MBC9199784.1 hypothetical protein [Paenibacillus sp. PL91]
MEIKGEVKEVSKTNITANKEAKTAINFYGVAGIIFIVVGVFMLIFDNIYSGITIAALGFLVMGIGEILRFLNKISNRSL